MGRSQKSGVPFSGSPSEQRCVALYPHDPHARVNTRPDTTRARAQRVVSGLRVSWMLRKLQKRATWDFPKIRSTILEGLYNKDYSILGSILGCPYVGKVPLVRHEFPNFLL